MHLVILLNASFIFGTVQGYYCIMALQINSIIVFILAKFNFKKQKK